MGPLEDRVVIVTGAGQGIGREHALLLAGLGAKVVVNDLGGASDGTGADSTRAEEVAAEIVASGGTAVANDDSVSDFAGAARVVETAVDAFGDLHAVVNNAGILRDRMLVSMSEADFDAVVGVHLKGTFNVARHAAELWRSYSKQERTAPRAIVNTSSAAGLHGNVGQSNYVAAKAGIAGLTLAHAYELKRYGVRVNCIAPIARTRLTQQTPGIEEAIADGRFDPGHSSLLVAYLASAACRFSGQVFSVYGGSVGIYQGWSIHEELETSSAWGFSDLTAALEQLPRRVSVRNQLDVITKYSAG